MYVPLPLRGKHGAMTVQAERRRVYSYAEAKPVIAGAKLKRKIRTAKGFGEYFSKLE
jgi:hypothetical protein